MGRRVIFDGVLGVFAIEDFVSIKFYHIKFIIQNDLNNFILYLDHQVSQHD